LRPERQHDRENHEISTSSQHDVKSFGRPIEILDIQVRSVRRKYLCLPPS
jgi:hypothetical protein